MYRHKKRYRKRHRAFRKRSLPLKAQLRSQVPRPPPLQSP